MVGAALKHVLAACRARPLLTGVLAAGTKGALADVCSQCVFQASEDYKPKRTAAFALWNASYCGLMVYAMYSVWLPRILPIRTLSGGVHPHATRHTAISVAFDNFLATPLLCLPTYYFFDAILEDGSCKTPLASMRTALGRYASEAREMLLVDFPTSTKPR